MARKTGLSKTKFATLVKISPRFKQDFVDTLVAMDRISQQKPEESKYDAVGEKNKLLLSSRVQHLSEEDRKNLLKYQHMRSIGLMADYVIKRAMKKAGMDRPRTKGYIHMHFYVHNGKFWVCRNRSIKS